MKKVVAIILFLMLVIPNVASAHAELESSQPQNGETVKQSIDTLTLQFGEEVEKFISFTITNGAGDSMPVDSTSISGKTVLVLTKKPLPQGDYTAKWELVSEDGHNATGELSFKVGQVEEKAQSNQPIKNKNTEKKQNTSPTSDHQSLYIGIIVVLIVILGASAVAVLRKKQ